MMDFPQFGMSTHIFGGFDPKVPLAGSRSQLRLMVWLAGLGSPWVARGKTSIGTTGANLRMAGANRSDTLDRG